MHTDNKRGMIYAMLAWGLLVVLGYVLYVKPLGIAHNGKVIFQVISIWFIANLLCFGLARIYRISIGVVTFGLIGLRTILLLFSLPPRIQ